MGAPRIKGQDLELLIVAGGEAKVTIRAFKDFDMTFKMERLTEEFLGETTVRVDDIFKGIEGKMTLQHESQDLLVLMTQIVERARRRTPGFDVNLKVALQYPNGQRPRIIIPKIAFGDLPLGFGGRSEYAETGIDFGAESATVISV